MSGSDFGSRNNVMFGLWIQQQRQVQTLDPATTPTSSSDFGSSNLLTLGALHLQEGLADIGPILRPDLETAESAVEENDRVYRLQGRQHIEEGAVAHVPQRVNDAEHAPSHVQHTPDKQDRRTFAASDEAAEAALLLDNSEPGEVGQKVGDEDADA
mmetsp:Transcript_71708/g.156060  ORF Transcript_71708/g.156060 Transcript_71708/m.156060 type:complete len:156 (-) Transcript_71708:386-853(-)